MIIYNFSVSEALALKLILTHIRLGMHPTTNLYSQPLSQINFILNIHGNSFINSEVKHIYSDSFFLFKNFGRVWD